MAHPTTLEIGGSIRAATPRSRRTTRRWRPGPVSVWALPAAVALLASLAWSWNPSLWTDEDATVSAVTRPVPGLLALLRSIDAVHGSYYLLMHAWVSVSGVSPVLLRLPSAVVTAVAAAGVAVLARRLTGSGWTATAAGLAYALLPITSYYGMEARSVAFGSAAAVWASWALVRALAPGGTRWWWLYAGLLGVGSALHVYLLLLVPAHAITLVLTRPARTVLLRWAAACALGAGLASPVLALALGESAQVGWLTVTRWSQVPQQAVRLWFEDSRPVALVAWALVALGVWALVRTRAAARPRAVPAGTPGTLALTLPWLVLPPALVFAVSTVHALYTPRYFFFCVPALAVLMGAGVTALRSRKVGVLLVVALLAAGVRIDVKHRAVDGKGDDIAAVNRILATTARPGDAVLYRPDTRRLAEIGDPSELGRLDDVALDRSAVASDSLWGTDLPRAELVTRLGGVQRLWIVDRPGSKGPGGSDVVRKDQALAIVGFRQQEKWRTGHSEVQLLVRKTP